MNLETDPQPLDPNAALTPMVPTPTPQPSILHRIFVGKDGIRAGWSLLIFILIISAIGFCARVVGRKLGAPDPGKSGAELTPLFAIAGEGVPFLLVLLVTWIMAKIERRPNSVYGFGDRRRLPHFLAGLAWGIVCLSLLVGVLLKAGLLVIDHRLIFSSDILRYGAIWLLAFLFVGLLEEYLTRGFLQYTLTRGLAGLYQLVFKTRHSATLGFWTSALIFSILFGLGHGSNPGESPIGMLSAGLAGFVFCLSLWRTGSLWWAVGFHTSWDWAQSFLYGVPDSGVMVQHHFLATHPVGKPVLSGGTTGPEGSIFIVAVLALVVLIILFTLPRTPYGQAVKVTEA